MKLVRTLSLALFALGALVLVVGIACSDGDEKQEATPEPTATVPAETPTSTAPATNTPRPTPTATPTPFNGAVARIKIPRFNVDAPIENLAINAAGELDTPKDTNRSVGWYDIYDKPGFGGNAIFSAHVYYHSIPAPFVSLAKSAAGDKIVTWYLSANFDEAEHVDPYSFDIGRRPNRHVTFGGGGPHLCLGQWLARLEVRLVLEELVPRLTRVAPAGPPERVRSNFINGLKSLPLSWQVR